MSAQAALCVIKPPACLGSRASILGCKLSECLAAQLDAGQDINIFGVHLPNKRLNQLAEQAIQFLVLRCIRVEHSTPTI